MLPIEFGSDIIFLNDMVTSSCTVNKGDFPIDIFWKFNDRRIASEDGITISRTNQRMSVLTIEAVRDHHSGNYTCVAQNRAGQVQQTALLQVNVGPSVFPFDFGEEPVDMMNTVSIQCVVSKGDTPIMIEWLFNAVPQIMPFEFGEDPFDSSSTVSVQCVVTKGDVPIDIGWMFNGRRISSNDGITVSKLGQKMSTLYIESIRSRHAANDAVMITNSGPRISILSIDAVDSRHAGNYTCHASNRAGSTKHTAELQVMVLPVILPFEFGEDALDEASMATVNCAVTKGDTPLSFSWMFNGEDVVLGESGILVSKSGQRISMLTIESVQSYHAGNYTCIAKNIAGHANHTSELKVIVKPQIMPFEFGEEPFDMLTTSTVSCAVIKGDAPIEINWIFNGENVGSGDGVTVTKSGPKMSILFIDSVQPRHAGRYTCVAHNKAGFVEHSSELKVIVLPVLLPFEFGDEPADVLSTTMVSCAVAKGDTPLEIEWLFEGLPPILLPFEFGEDPSDIHSTTTVSCAVAKGDTPIEINWMFNGSKIFSNDGITITKSGQKMSLLYIESVQARHSGNYTCVARNKAGFVEHTSELKVIVLPIIMPFDFGEDPFDIYSTTTVTCAVTKGDSPIEISWYFNSYRLRTNDGVLITPVLPIILPFEFGEEPFDIYSATTVSCAVTKGDLPITIAWLFNDREIHSGDGVLITNSGHRISMLSIESVQPRHAGNYSCVANNKAGTAEYSSILNVMVVPYIMPFEFGDEPFDTSAMTTVSCAVTKGDMPIEIVWSFNGQPLYTGDDNGVIITKSGHRVSMLTIESIRWYMNGNQLPTNENGVIIGRVSERLSSLSIDPIGYFNRGTYECRVKNRAGEAFQSAELVINVVPTIMQFSFGEEILNTGDSVAVNCMVVKGDSPLEIRWYLNNVPISSENEGIVVVKLSEKLSSLSINAIEPQHRGLYECRVKNKAGEASSNAELIINVLPKIFPFSFGEDPSYIDSFVTVQCAATIGDLPMFLEWLHDGELVSKSNDYGISIVHSSRRVSTLTIESIRDHHAGNYTCRARNLAGVAEQSTQLIINGL
uniref:Ig-like domain-containing protein n=1 Tax=Anopheles maculatus TaxID=74869 RepID=A0A182SAI8_9DIPT